MTDQPITIKGNILRESSIGGNSGSGHGRSNKENVSPNGTTLFPSSSSGSSDRSGGGSERVFTFTSSVPFQRPHGLPDVSTMPPSERRRFERAFGGLSQLGGLGDSSSRVSSGRDASSSYGHQIQEEDQFQQSTPFRQHYGGAPKHSASTVHEKRPIIRTEVRSRTLGVRGRSTAGVWAPYQFPKRVEIRPSGEGRYLGKVSEGNLSGVSRLRDAASSSDGKLQVQDSDDDGSTESLSDGSESEDDFDNDDEFDGDYDIID